jgi:hypothetical protein
LRPESQGMKLSTIKPNPDNPRTIKDESFEKLCRSITEFPKMMELRPIVTDDQGVILGGNMRFKALQHLNMKDIPDNWVKRAAELTDEERRRFIVTDNVGFGDWDVDDLAANWDREELDAWGVEVDWGVGIEVGTDGFTLPDGDKAPFQQMTFTLADEQAIVIQNAILDIKQTQEYKYAETMGNENSNGNALYLIVMQWAEQRK